MALALIRLGLGIGLLVVTSAAFAAEALPDPTRPPAIVTEPTPKADKLRPAAEALVLQSVLVSPTRKVAVISGIPLMPGGRIREHTLIDVSTSGATLDGPEGRIDLKLFGGTDRRATKTAHPGPTKRAPTLGSSRP